MKKRSLLYIILILAVCLSCHRNSALDSMESLVQEYPDSALSVLQGIRPSSIKGKGEKARYALLYSVALDKNYIDVDSDTTIIKAVRWYEKTGDRHHLMLSYYYAGRVEYNSANYAGATSYAQKAMDLAVQSSDSYYQGMICWLFGDIYYANHNYIKARFFFDKADESFRESHKERYSFFSKCESAKMYLALGDYHKCDSVLNVVISSIDKEDSPLLSTYYSLAVRSRSIQGKDAEAIETFEIWNRMADKADPLTVYGQAAISYARTGDRKKALECLDLSYMSASEDQLPLVSSYSASVLYIGKEYKQAIDSLKKGYDYQNRVANIQFANSIDDALSEFYKSEARLKEQKMNVRMALISFIALIIVMLSLAYYLLRKKEYTEKLNAAKADIAFISQMNKDTLKGFAKFMQIRQGVLDDVISGYSTEKSTRKAGAIYDVVDDKIEGLKAGGDGYKKLVKDLNDCFGNIVKKLKEIYPDISQQDNHILVYYFSGFSQETVSILTGVPVQKLYNFKRSWAERFARLASPEKELFLSRLNPTKNR
jgi:tetratricopeptide (TPR) repeat protein